MAVRLLFSSAAVLLLVAGSACAGFTNDWWNPAWTGYQTTNPASVLPLATNVWGRKWHITIDQTSTTNYIPVQTWDWPGSWWIAGYGNFPPFVRDWTRDLKEEANSAEFNSWATASILIGPIGASTNSTRTITINSKEWIQPDVNYTYVQSDTNASYDGNWYGRDIWDAGQSHPYAVQTNIYGHTNTFTVGASTQSVVSVITVWTEGAHTNYLLFPEDARAYDVYSALRTRWALLEDDYEADVRQRDTTYVSGGVTYMSGGLSISYKPVLGRWAKEDRGTSLINPVSLSDWRNIGRMKAFCKALITYSGDRYYADHNAATNWVDYFGTNLSGATFPSMTVTQALAQAGAPSNYLDHTEYRAFNSPVFYGPTITQSYTIVTTSTNAATNTVYDYVGNARALVGTNGQVVSFTSTNTSILAGFTEQDYGWKYLPIIITQSLTQIASSWVAAYTNTTKGYCADADWDVAKATATNDIPGVAGTWPIYSQEEAFRGNLYMMGSAGRYSAPGAYYAVAWKHDQMTLKCSTASNLPDAISCDVEAYVGSEKLGGGASVYDTFGETLSENKYELLYSAHGTNGEQTVIIGLTGMPTNWCAQPTAGTNTALGYKFVDGGTDRPVLFKYTIED